MLENLKVKLSKSYAGIRISPIEIKEGIDEDVKKNIRNSFINK